MWTLELFRRYRPYLTSRSIWTLRSALLSEDSRLTTLRMRAPKVTIQLRPRTIDMSTFDDVFLHQIYGPLTDQPVRTLIDVGANIGLVSLYVQAAHPGVRIFAVEPDADNFALLTGNLLEARSIHAALWNTDGPVTFAPDTPTTGQVVEGLAGTTVPGYTMHSLIKQSGFHMVDLLKVDVEGGERHLFAGDRGWVSRVHRLIVEWHGDTRHASGFDAVMSQAGFTLHELDDHTTIATSRGASSR